MAFNKVLSASLLVLVSIQLSSAGLIKRTTCSTGQTVRNAACCALFPIVADMRDNMLEGECGDAAHTALRLMFHDAIGISPTKGGGGADGSVAVFDDIETAFPANAGIDDALAIQTPFMANHTSLTPGDFIQLAGAVSLANCPGAPRVPFLLGHPAPKAASPPGLIPEPTDSVTTILARFKEVGFSPAEVVALLASHSVAGADNIDPTIPGTPFDSTPSTFDGQMFVEVLLKGTLFPGTGNNTGESLTAVAGGMRLTSDGAIARDSRTACSWQSLVNDQTRLEIAFGAAMFKLSLLGQDTSKMIDCSEVIPQPPSLNKATTFPPGTSVKNIDHACGATPFPTLATQPGPATTIPAIPQ